MLTELLVASRNPKKLAELRRVLDSAGVALTLLSLDDVAPFDETPEIGATFEENALAKARDAFRATGLPSVADDSGLEVDALNGMPGVLSARWSGRHGDDAANTALLLAQMADVPDERRGAAFVSACALVYPAGEPAKIPSCAGGGRAPSSESPAARAASATTRCFCPRAGGALRPNSVRSRKTQSHIGVVLCRRCFPRCGSWRPADCVPVKCPCRRDRQGQRRGDQDRQ